MGTPWEHDGNTLGRREKNKKSLSPPLVPCPIHPKEKKLDCL
jgi:hypothetical protein